MVHTEWAGTVMQLLGQRAVHLPAERTLVIADTHFGKPAAFRVAGIPVPRGTTESDLSRLDALLDRTAARRLVILGDFFHSATGCDAPTLEALGAWRKRRRALPILLVRGNHDAKAGDPPAEWGIECVPEARGPGDLLYRHHPEPEEGAFVLAGHLHPAIVLSGMGDCLRSPCFWFGDDVAVLPAFGSFTGMKAVRPRRGDRVFAVGPDEVIEVTHKRAAS